MTAKDYQSWVPTVNGDNISALLSKLTNSSTNAGDVVLAAFGLPGEVGEVVDLLKKWIFHDRQMDTEHLKKEMGDVLWYFTLLADTFDFSLEDIMQANADKLNARFPTDLTLMMLTTASRVIFDILIRPYYNKVILRREYDFIVFVKGSDFRGEKFH